jgi:hypothetical protein
MAMNTFIASYSATVAPFAAPEEVAQIWVRTDTKQVWVSTGKTLISDWELVTASNWGSIGGNIANQTDLQTALGLKEDAANKGAVNGYAPLGATSLVPYNYLGIGTPTVTKFLRSDGVWATPTADGDSGIGSLTFYNEDGSQDDIPINAFSTVLDFAIETSLTMKSEADVYVDSVGSYGWSDLLAEVNVRGVGVNNPTWGAVFNAMQGYLFSGTTMNEFWCDFHINHDYAMGTVVFPHVHWMPITNDLGTVRWGFEYAIAKGHQQADSFFNNGFGGAAGSTTTVYVEQTISSPSQFKHFIAEIAVGLPADQLEPDAVIKMRVFRDAANVGDTLNQQVHAMFADIHYQVGRFSTKNKAPNFFA